MNALVRLVSITVCHSAALSVSGDLRMLMPALLTRISRRPCRAAALSISARQDVSLVTSTSVNSASPPACAMRRTAASPFLALRPASTTMAPAEARPSAIPSPMPPLPPVTIATWSERSNKLMGFPRCDEVRAPVYVRQPGQGNRTTIGSRRESDNPEAKMLDAPLQFDQLRRRERITVLRRGLNDDQPRTATAGLMGPLR